MSGTRAGLANPWKVTVTNLGGLAASTTGLAASTTGLAASATGLATAGYLYFTVA